MARSTGPCVPASTSSGAAANKVMLALSHTLCACCILTLIGRSSDNSTMLVRLISMDDLDACVGYQGFSFWHES